MAPGIESSRALPTRERLLVIVGLAGIVVLSWAYLMIEAGPMGNLSANTVMELRPRDGTSLVLLFLMWAVMMVAMMLPSAMPMILLFAAVARKIETGQSFATLIGSFVGGVHYRLDPI